MTRNRTVETWACTLGVVFCTALFVWAIIQALGCGQPIQTLQMVIDGNGHVVSAEWYWVDERQDYCRLEAVRDPAWLRVGCRNGDVLAY